MASSRRAAGPWPPVDRGWAVAGLPPSGRRVQRPVRPQPGTALDSALACDPESDQPPGRARLGPSPAGRLHVHAVRRAGSGHHEAAGRSNLGLEVARIGIKRFEGSVMVLERSRMITLLYSPKI